MLGWRLNTAPENGQRLIYFGLEKHTPLSWTIAKTQTNQKKLTAISRLLLSPRLSRRTPGAPRATPGLPGAPALEYSFANLPRV